MTFKFLCLKNKKLQQLIRISPLHSSLQDEEVIPDFLTNKKPSMHFSKNINCVLHIKHKTLSHTVHSTWKKVFLFVLPTNWTWLNFAMTSTIISVFYEKQNSFQKILPADQTDQCTILKQPQTGQHHLDAIITSTLT